jgi:hypothetical protein
VRSSLSHTPTPSWRYILSSKPAQSSVTEAVANINRVFGNTKQGSSFVIWISNRVQANGPIFLWLLQYLMTYCICLFWYVATPIDLAGNFLFQGFIYQLVWIKRTFNGKFIITRNLWIVVIKFALTFIESPITHLLLKATDTRLSFLLLALCSVLQSLQSSPKYVIWFTSIQVYWVSTMYQVQYIIASTDILCTVNKGIFYISMVFALDDPFWSVKTRFSYIFCYDFGDLPLTD